MVHQARVKNNLLDDVRARIRNSLWYCRFCRAEWNFVTSCQRTVKRPAAFASHQASLDRDFPLCEWRIQTVLSLSLICSRHYVDPGCNQASPFQSFRSALQFKTCFNSTGHIMLALHSMACIGHLYRTRILTWTQVTQATFCLPGLRLQPLWYACFGPGP